jgi:transposase-like protein
MPTGQSVDFRLSKHRDTLAAMAFFENAMLRPHNDSPETLVVDRNPSYPVALELLKKSGHLSPTAQLKTGPALNNLIRRDGKALAAFVEALFRGVA